jgi:hypothetical protein
MRPAAPTSATACDGGVAPSQVGTEVFHLPRGVVCYLEVAHAATPGGSLRQLLHFLDTLPAQHLDWALDSLVVSEEPASDIQVRDHHQCMGMAHHITGLYRPPHHRIIAEVCLWRQVVCNYLACLERGTVDQTQLRFGPGRGGGTAAALPEGECRRLLDRYFYSQLDYLPSLNTLRVFLGVCADQVRTLLLRCAAGIRILASDIQATHRRPTGEPISDPSALPPPQMPVPL